MNGTNDERLRRNRTRRTRARFVAALGIIGIAAPVVRGDDQAVASFPAAPTMGLAPMEGSEGLAASVADHVARLVELAGQSNLPILRAELQLAGANLILGRQIEPTCTRSFWGLDHVEALAPDDRKVAEAFDMAGRLLNDAEARINEARRTAPKGEPEAGENATEKDPSMSARISAASSHQRTLEAFHQALIAALVPPGADDRKRARRRAASELSALVEHDDRRVATAAGFWQAYLRKDEADPHASLARLDYALDEFAPPEQPYAFFARVMRCEVLAAHGQPVAALALLTQMEERALGWYGEEDSRKQALRAIAWAKLHTLRIWHEDLDAAERADERVWCREQAAELIANALQEPRTLPRLSPAIPLLLDADGVEAAAAAGHENTP